MRHSGYVRIIFTIIFFTFTSTSLSKSSPTPDLLYNSWNTLLKKYVSKDGGVNYVGFSQDFDTLKSLIDQYNGIKVEGLSDSAKKATYINLYNATMIYNILKYSKEKKIDVNSKEFLELRINDIKVEGGNIWNGSYTVGLAGKQVTLDDIEHNLVRGKADDELASYKVSKLDPRIHAAVNCAALSCPRVREIAYTESNIDKLLDENIREYMTSDIQFKKIDETTMQANSIVFWYYGDFDDFGQKDLKVKGAGDYLSTFIGETPNKEWKIAHLKKNFNDRSRFSLKFSSAFDFEYDWKINDKRNKN